MKILNNIHEDYINNFMPRKEIKIRLSLEEMKSILTNKEFQMNWHFFFYLKQLFLLSIKPHIEEKDKRTQIIQELIDLTRFDSINKIQAIVATIRVTYDLEEISDFALYEIFNGSSIYDDYCAQIAYEEYTRRKTVTKATA